MVLRKQILKHKFVEMVLHFRIVYLMRLDSKLLDTVSRLMRVSEEAIEILKISSLDTPNQISI